MQLNEKNVFCSGDHRHDLESMNLAQSNQGCPPQIIFFRELETMTPRYKLSLFIAVQALGILQSHILEGFSKIAAFIPG